MGKYVIAYYIIVNIITSLSLKFHMDIVAGISRR